MTEGFQIVSNRCDRSDCDIRFLNQQVADKATAFHSSFPQYRPTPLRRLQALAGQMGVGEIFVKDESYRFGLNAFKVLGGSFAIGQYIAQRLGRDLSELPYSVMTSPEVKRELGELTFVTATDGNHGRGVAWTANQLGQKSVVYMPKGSAPERLENIRKENSDASITDLRYDDTVRLAKQRAEQPNCVLVQDTSWDGYTEVPSWILQGYTTMANEVREELERQQQESQQLLAPTHIFLQAGVGSMPAALAGYFTNIYAQQKPIITVVEPNKADCIFRTAKAADGRLHFVTEEMNTIMAGLACGEPCPIAWEVLRGCADFFISFPDYAAAKGMRILSSPLPGDERIVSGESGASAFGCVMEILSNPALSSLREQLGIDSSSRLLFISTEGATDRENYRAIVWDGKYPSF